MEHPVMILTDSSASIPNDLVAQYPIRVMPLLLNWDGQSYRDGVDIQPEEFYKRLLTSNTLPHTSQLSAGEINKNVRQLINNGYDVLMMPISSGISNTYQTAVEELQKFPKDRATVMDTNLVCMALGLQVLAAARAAAAGMDLSSCEQIAQKAYGNIGVFGALDTLKYLAAGGRINSAKRLLGSAVNLKPIVEFRGGKVELAGSAFSSRKALERMLDLVEKEIGNRTPVRICVFHALAKDPAQELLAKAQERFSPIESILSDFTPVIGAHVGPGTIAIAFKAGAESEITPQDVSGILKLHKENAFQKQENREPVYA
ncbi:MAG TPA: DegV family protein [Anaerolineaceae bacterium]|nr:DegV family protein [Anaerolineaceae bacterium]